MGSEREVTEFGGGNPTRDHPPTTCSKCGKEVKRGKILWCIEGLFYCWHCGYSRYCRLLVGEIRRAEQEAKNVNTG